MQLAGRLALPWLLGRFTDRSLTAISAVMMVAAFVLLIWSTVLPVFIAAQLLQGAARAIFWTSSQAHAIRDQPEPIRRLVDLNVAGNAGTLVGPAVGGLLASIGLTVALVAGAAGALVAVAGTAFLRAFPPFDRKRSAGTRRLLRRTGVDVACWASVVGGLWWSMMGSFVPVLLVARASARSASAGRSPDPRRPGCSPCSRSGRSRRTRIAPAVRIAAVVASVALVLIALLPPVLPIAIALLLIGGAAAGSVTTLSPAMATLVASADEQGDALSLTGTFRAAALFASPAAVGVLVTPFAVGPAMAIVTLAVGAAGAVVGRDPDVPGGEPRAGPQAVTATFDSLIFPARARSLRIWPAASLPGAPITQPPGCVPGAALVVAVDRGRGTGVQPGAGRKKYICGARNSPAKMLPSVSPTVRSMSSGVPTSRWSTRSPKPGKNDSSVGLDRVAEAAPARCPSRSRAGGTARTGRSSASRACRAAPCPGRPSTGSRSRCTAASSTSRTSRRRRPARGTPSTARCS